MHENETYNDKVNKKHFKMRKKKKGKKKAAEQI